MEITIPYKPRPQFRPLHDRTERWGICVAHRRAGKTVACVNDLIRAALLHTGKDPRFAYVAPTFAQAKDVAWNYLVEFTLGIPGATRHETELRVDLPNGSRVRLYGSDNYDRLRGVYLDGIVMDEYGDVEPRAWSEVIRPALSDRKGWAIFIGTPRGRNHFADLWDQAATTPDWFRLRLPASETGILPQDELTDARRAMTQEQYDSEYECSFSAPVVGSYYGLDIDQAEAQKRIIRVPVERGIKVHTAWDLGIGDSTAIWLVQLVGREVHVIDYIENAGVGLDWYAKELQTRGHIYGSRILPHDAEARELGTGTTRVEVLTALGIRATVLPAMNVQDGINAVRMLLPRCWFNADTCKAGIDALRHYRREWDAKKKVFKPNPLHDWSSHGSDAFRYLAQGLPRTDETQKPLVYNTKWIV